MEKYTNKEKNKYNGIRVAKYEEEKKSLKQFQTRKKEELESINKCIEEESSIYSRLESEKNEALISGKQEEFLKKAQELRTSKDSLDYYTGRKDSLKEVARVKEEEFIHFAKSIRNEQNRLNKDCLKWLHEELTGIFSVLKEVHKELSEGDSLLKEAASLFEESNKPEVYEKTIVRVPGYDSFFKKFSYPENSVPNLLGNIEGHLKYLEQDNMKKWLD